MASSSSGIPAPPFITRLESREFPEESFPPEEEFPLDGRNGEVQLELELLFLELVFKHEPPTSEQESELSGFFEDMILLKFEFFPGDFFSDIVISSV